MKWYRRNKPYVLIAPAFLLIIFLVGYSLMMAFLESIQYNQSPSLEVYQALLKQEGFLDSFLYSIRISLISTILAIFFGLCLVRFTYPLLERFFPKLMAWLPMLFPHFVWGYMLYLLLSQTGFLSSVFNVIGITNEPGDFPILFKDPFGWGIILTYVWKEIPFVILMLLPVYEQLSYSQREVVYTLGGKEGAVFRYVEWPYVFPVLLETFFIIFSFVLSAYEVPALLGTTYPKMLSVLSYDWFFGTDWGKQPYAFASMMVTTGTILSLAWLAAALTKKSRKHLNQTQGDGKRTVGIEQFSKISFLVITILALLPSLLLLLTSFARHWTFGNLLPDCFCTRAWHVLFKQEPHLWEAVMTTIEISLLVLLLNLLIGIPAAKGMALYEFSGKTTVEIILLSPVLIPTLAVAMGIHLTFIRLGMANHLVGVVIVHLLPTLPYTIKILRAGFERIGRKQEDLASSLGAKSFKVFRFIYLPQLLPSIRSVIFLVTVISLGQYLVTVLIGGGNVTTLAILYFPFFQSADDAIIASFSLLFALIPVAIWVVLELLLRVIIKNKTGW